MSNKKRIIKDLKDLKALNYKKSIKLRYKTLSGGSLSLYFDYWNGTKRQYQFIKIYLLNKITTYHEDNNKLKIALSVRDKKEIELFKQDNDFELKNWKRDANFIEYFKRISETYPPSERAWRNTYKHLRDFTKGFIKIKAVDDKFCEAFKEYLLSKVSANTGHTYFSKLLASLNKAIKDKIITYNPAQGISIKKTDTKKEFLTPEEVQTIIKTPFIEHQQLKNAFLFGCFTGLRISDIRQLTFDNIENEYIVFKQKKTSGQERIKLSKNALDIIEQQKEFTGTTGNIFDLPVTINRILKRFIKKAGITKHITFHCSRHTFATLCLTYDIDLYTVSKLLGHRDIKTTQIYAKLIDKKKDEAIDKLPQF